MATGIVKTFEASYTRYVTNIGNVTLYMQLKMTQTYDIGTGKSTLTFTDFRLMYSGGNIGSWTGYVDGLMTVTVNGTSYTIYNEYWSNSYTNKYNCAMKVNTYNPVKSASNGAAWGYTLTDIEHASDGSLSVTVGWSKISNVTNLRGYGLVIDGTEVVPLEANKAEVANIRIKINGVFVPGTLFVRHGGKWVKGSPKIKKGNVWVSGT